MYAKKALLDGKKGVLIEFESKDEFEITMEAMKQAVTAQNPKLLIDKMEKRFNGEMQSTYILGSECDQMFSLIVDILVTNAKINDDSLQEQEKIREEILQKHSKLYDALAQCCKITNEMTELIVKQ